MVWPGPAVETSGVLVKARSGAALSVSLSCALAVLGVELPVVFEPSSAMLALLTMLLTPAATGLSTLTTKVAEPLPPPPARALTAMVQTVPAAAPLEQLVHP